MNEQERALAREEEGLVADCFPPLFSVLRESLRGGEAFSTLDAAIRLYADCPCLHFFLSGTERPGADYSEPRYMAEYLAARGVPPERILRDGEGFNTRLTFENAKKNGIRRCVVLSNDFHLLRCVDTARRLGLDAYAYRVPFVNVLSHPYRWRYWVREKLALYWGYFRSLTKG